MNLTSKIADRTAKRVADGDDKTPIFNQTYVGIRTIICLTVCISIYVRNRMYIVILSNLQNSLRNFEHDADNVDFNIELIYEKHNKL